MQPCEASRSGGFIQISCDAKQAGGHGWTARLSRCMGLNGLKLMHRLENIFFQFRYLPWDVPAGLFLFMPGLAASMWICLKPHRNNQG